MGDRRLTANARVVQKAVKQGASSKTGIEYRIEGARGLVLLVMPSCRATWYFHYDVEVGKRRRRRKLKLGRVDAISLADALVKAQILRVEVAAGSDPVAAKATRRVALTFAELAEQRIANGDLRASTKQEYRLVLAKDALPILGNFPATEVTREHVVSVIDPMAQRGATRRADTARAMISSIFSFGIDRGVVQDNPAAGLRRRHDYQPRDVVLTSNQLRRLWLAMETGDAAMSQVVSNIVRLAAFTGQRRAELAGLRQVDIEWNANAPCLIITRGQTKNRNQHRVPLSRQAYAVCCAARAAATNSEYLFPGPDSTSIHPRSVSKAMERTRSSLGLGGVNIHDLRRTVGSLMTQYGVPKEVRERVLNHGGKRTSSVTESVYSWYDYEPEKRAALELWADALEALVSGTGAELADYSNRLALMKGSSVVRILPSET
jgi:integrase